MASGYNVKRIPFADGSEVVMTSDHLIITGKPRKPRVPRGCRRNEIETPFGPALYEIIDEQEAFREMTPEEKARSFRHSINRTKNVVEIIARCNLWEYFVTVTLNQEYLVASDDYETAKTHFEHWLDCLRKRYIGVKYIGVMEQGKKGNRWHMHLLVANAKLRLVDSGVKDGRHNRIYNFDMSEYKYGFSTVTRVRDSGAASRYLAKYIGKELAQVPKNAKRYWSTKNLVTEKDVVVKYLFDNREMAIFTNQMLETCDTHSDCYIAVCDNTVHFYRFFSTETGEPCCPT